MNQNDVPQALDCSPVDLKQGRHFVKSETFDALRKHMHQLHCAVEIAKALGHRRMIFPRSFFALLSKITQLAHQSAHWSRRIFLAIRTKTGFDLA